MELAAQALYAHEQLHALYVATPIIRNKYMHVAKHVHGLIPIR